MSSNMSFQISIMGKSTITLGSYKRPFSCMYSIMNNEFGFVRSTLRSDFSCKIFGNGLFLINLDILGINKIIRVLI